MRIKVILLLTLLSIYSVSISKTQQFIMATTTSTDNSGLLDYLLPLFKKTYNINVKVIATGTGKALKLAEKGDVDMVMVHAPDKEKQFIANGFGVNRQKLMYNQFLVVGPTNDPAHIKNLKTVAKAFSAIKQTQSIFISRGDNSGTYFKEIDIWQKSKDIPIGSWYMEVGQGMGKTLQIANEFNGYTLVDQGTWLKLKNKLQLKVLYYGDPIMLNPYSVILVNPKKYPDINYKSAQIFINWITSDRVKKIINSYKINNQQLFFTEDNTL